MRLQLHRTGRRYKTFTTLPTVTLEKWIWLSVSFFGRTTQPPSDWYGVTVNDDGRVRKLILEDNNLEGELTNALGALDALQHLDLSQNQLSGTIPAELGQLTNLWGLELDFNELTGAIPAELTSLTDMLRLRLEYNQLSCDIPDLSRLEILHTLSLRNNRQLGGTLSENVIDIWDNLASLDIGCTSIQTPDTMEFRDWLGGITSFRRGCDFAVTPLSCSSGERAVLPQQPPQQPAANSRSSHSSRSSRRSTAAAAITAAATAATANSSRSNHHSRRNRSSHSKPPATSAATAA